MIELISRFYTHDVTVYRITEGISSETGENIKTASTITSNLKCRVRPITNAESYYQNKNNLEISHYMYCEVSTAYNQQDRVVYGSSTFEINSIINPMGMDKYQRVGLKAVI
jgi:hypothetical protein